MKPDKTGEFRRGWRVLATVFVGMGCGLSTVPYYSMSSFIEPLQAEFGWSPGRIGVALSVVIFMQFVTGPFAGRLCDRYGVRRLLIPSSVLLALVLFCMPLIRGSVYVLYGAYVVMGLAGAFTTSVAYSRVVVTWFYHHRGLALGIMMSGAAAMAMIVPIMLGRVIPVFGWQGGYVACGLLALAALPLLLLFLHERQIATSATGRLAYGLTTAEAVRTRYFWIMVVAATLVSPGISAAIAHLIPIIEQTGIARERAAGTASLLGMGILTGRFTAGYTLDLFPRPTVAVFLFMVPVFSFIIFSMQVSPLVPLAVFILGMSIGIEGDVFAYMTSRFFGMRNYGELFGWIFGTMCVTGSAGPLIILFFEGRGGYAAALEIFIGMFVLASILMLLLGKYPFWEVEMDEQSASSSDDHRPSVDGYAQAKPQPALVRE